MEGQKSISVYLKAGRNAATSYYRFCQFFDKIEADFTYHLMIPDTKWSGFFPIAIQPIWKKVYIFLYIYIRVFIGLMSDIFSRPEYIVISRTLISKIMPISFKLFLLLLKNSGTKIIYDFDDQIISAQEITRRDFDFFTKISDLVIVGSPILKSLVNDRYKDKVCFLPTTDGDFYGVLSESITTQRMMSFEKEIKIVWLGTFSGLSFLQEVIDAIEQFGNYLGTIGKKLRLIVVCDSFMDYVPKSFVLKNIKWTRQRAIEAVLESHIGIMPLFDNEITRGKCSFKLIQYLSAGLPIIGTNVGMNKDVIDASVGIGLNTNNKDDWNTAFIQITENKEKWLDYSKNALNEWQERYSFQKNLNNWKSFLNLKN